MTQAEQAVSVVICAYSEDRWDGLTAAVSSVQQQSVPSCEILVVIDHNACLFERARSQLQGVVVLENRAQQGLSGARNTGVEAARSALIAFLDDDAIAAPDWLQLLTRACIDRRVLGCGGLIEPVWQNSKPRWLPHEFYWVIGCSYRGLPETKSAIRNPIGASMCIRSDVFDAVGGFSSSVGRFGTHPLGCEETDLCLRAMQHWPQGLFLYEPAAIVLHAVPTRRTSWRYFCSRCFYEGQSKALVTQSVGTRDGLASERRYAIQTLPKGVAHGITDAIMHRDAAGLARAAAIIIGLGATAAGYTRATVARQLARLYSWLCHWQLSSRLQHIQVFALPVVALWLWSVSLAGIDVRRMTDLGLVLALPVLSFVALAVAPISFCLALRQAKVPVVALLVHLLVLVYMLYGITALVEEVPRFDVTYWIAGHTEYILRTGVTNPNYDAYFSWPGFFVLHGLATQLAGYQSAYESLLAWASWAPLFYNLLYLGPLYLILRSATNDTRLVWLGLLFFYMTDWIWQDYFAPQGLSFFFYLVVLAILLKWFIAPPTSSLRLKGRGTQRPRRWPLLMTQICSWLAASDILYTPSQRRQRVGLLCTIVAAFAFMVFSHPLTPFFVLAGVTPLVVLHNRGLLWLPFMLAAMVIGWDVIMAQPFWVGHMDMVIGGVENLGGVATSNVTSRAAVGSPDHQIIAELRILLTVSVLALALIGGVRRLRAGFHDAPYVLLAVVPPLIAIVQPYGGEVFMRVYLFTLPVMSFFAASAVCKPSAHRLNVWRTGVITLTALLLLGCFMFARYGNERADYYTNAELSAIRYLYQSAPQHSLWIGAGGHPPWEYQGLEAYAYVSLDPNGAAASELDEISNLITDKRYPAAYVILTRSERAQAHMYNDVSSAAFDQLEQALLRSGRFRIIYWNHDAQIFEYVEAQKSGTP